MSAREPTRDEVLAWIAERPNRDAAFAVDHFWPRAQGKDRERLLARVRKWLSRARKKPAGELVVLPRPQEEPDDEDAGADGDDDPLAKLEKLIPEPPPRPAPDYEWARKDRVAFLERQLAELLADLQWARDMASLRSIAALDRRVSDVRLELDQAKGEAARLVKLDRDPAAVAAELKKQEKALAILAERHRRAEAARAAAAAAGAPVERDL